MSMLLLKDSRNKEFLLTMDSGSAAGMTTKSMPLPYLHFSLFTPHSVVEKRVES